MTLAIPILFAAGGTVLVGIGLREVFRSLDPATVGGYRPCKGGWWEAELNRCDLGLSMLPQQPVNTYTNVTYLAGGLFLAIQLNTLPSYTFFLASLYLCVGSALYHGTSTRWAGSLDVSAMYALFSALAVYAVCTILGLDASLAALIMFVIAVLAGYFLRYQFRGNMQLKIGIFLGLTYVLVLVRMWTSTNWGPLGYFIASLALFAIAFVFWNMDKFRIFPIPRWGHGLWHVLTAAAISLLFYANHLTQ